MWIEICNGTRRFLDDEIMDEPIRFSKNGKVQVKTEVGNKLIEKYDSISQSTKEYEITDEVESYES